MLLSKGPHYTYLVSVAGSKYIMRAYHHPQRTLNDIREEMKLLVWLKKNNVPVQGPVQAVSGEYVSFYDEDGESCCMVLLEYIQGEMPKVFNHDKCYHFGKSLALIHHYTDQLEFQLDKPAYTPSFIRELSKKHVPVLLKDERQLQLLEEIGEKLEVAIGNIGIEEKKPYFGICHGDYYQMNALWLPDDSCRIIDFDFIAPGYRAYDLSMFMWNLAWKTKMSEAEKQAWWNAYLRGYNEVRKVSEKELSSVNLFVALYEVCMLGTRANASLFRSNGGFPDGYWDSCFDFLEGWVRGKCGIELDNVKR